MSRAWSRFLFNGKSIESWFWWGRTFTGRTSLNTKNFTKSSKLTVSLFLPLVLSKLSFQLLVSNCNKWGEVIECKKCSTTGENWKQVADSPGEKLLIPPFNENLGSVLGLSTAEVTRGEVDEVVELSWVDVVVELDWVAEVEASTLAENKKN